MPRFMRMPAWDGSNACTSVESGFLGLSRLCLMTPKIPKMRSPIDRVRQVALFEIGGLLLITPPFVWLTGVSLVDSLGLLAMIAAIAAVWNALYNTSFDWVEGRMTGRTSDQRPVPLRIVHAAGFEGGLLLVSLPVVMAWTGMGWVEALLADVGLAVTYMIYAYVFNLGYDRVFPVSQAV